MIGRQLDVLISAGRAPRRRQGIPGLAVNGRNAMPAGGKLIIHTANTEVDADHTASGGRNQPTRLA